jgi:hypothetical protein
MLPRLFSLMFAAVVLTILAAQPAVAADKSHEGIVVSAGEGKLTMTMMDGKNKHSHEVAAAAKITLDDKKPCSSP